MFASSNLVPIVFFGVLIIIGYSSVALTIYELVLGIPYVGDRSDIIEPGKN